MATAAENHEVHEVPEIMRGHLDECLAHLSRCFSAHVRKGSKEARIMRQPITEFIGLGDPAIARWLSRPKNPILGQNKFRLMCFLDMVGYRVMELEKLKNRRGFVELIGYGLMTAKDIVEALQYGHVYSIYHIFKPGFELGSEVEQRMWDTWKQRKEELERKKAEAREKCHLGFPLVTKQEKKKPVQQSLPISRSEEAKRLPSSHSAVICSMETLEALLDEGRLNGFSDDELKDLPSEIKRVVFRLTSRLTMLSSKLVNGD